MATDSSGNATTLSFQVTVRGASEQLHDLAGLVATFDLPAPTERRLVALVRLAARLGERDRVHTSCGLLQTFRSRVRALAGDELTADQADRLIADSARIQAVLGCG